MKLQTLENDQLLFTDDINRAVENIESFRRETWTSLRNGSKLMAPDTFSQEMEKRRVNVKAVCSKYHETYNRRYLLGLLIYLLFLKICCCKIYSLQSSITHYYLYHLKYFRMEIFPDKCLPF